MGPWSLVQAGLITVLPCSGLFVLALMIATLGGHIGELLQKHFTNQTEQKKHKKQARAIGSSHDRKLQTTDS